MTIWWDLLKKHQNPNISFTVQTYCEIKVRCAPKEPECIKENPEDGEALDAYPLNFQKANFTR